LVKNEINCGEALNLLTVGRNSSREFLGLSQKYKNGLKLLARDKHGRLYVWLVTGGKSFLILTKGRS
jgi:hypothetical protein